MALEIERKFLVRVIPDLTVRPILITQGYVADLFGIVVRGRQANAYGFMTFKWPTGKDSLGVNEVEFKIPRWVTRALLKMSFLGTIQKRRYLIPYRGHIFELDVFDGRLSGLVLAEVELDHENEKVDLPPWIGEEVTGQSQYFNKQLAKRKGL